MKIEEFVNAIGQEFYVGVPDSQLKSLCDYLISTYGIDPKHHIIAANEGNAVALAAGYYMATKRIPVVYMQNSGEGNAINPIASLTHKKVYDIPAIYIIGWRGEPGVHDEPQHIHQGAITLKLLEDMDIKYFVVDKDTDVGSIASFKAKYETESGLCESVAFVVRKGALAYDKKISYQNTYSLNREDVISTIVQFSEEAPIICTTGKASRELFEIREKYGENHKKDFLTVGSMGHCSSIAMEIAVQKPETKVWCIDGDGAAIMHLGAMATIGGSSPNNLVHVVINNGAHETVGGMPTVAEKIDLVSVAKACGYPHSFEVKTAEELRDVLRQIKKLSELVFLSVKCSIGSRSDLGRPTTLPIDNRNDFMMHLSKL